METAQINQIIRRGSLRSTSRILVHFRATIVWIVQEETPATEKCPIQDLGGPRSTTTFSSKYIPISFIEITAPS